MKIHFVISSLRPGGAERVVSRLANYWANRGHDVSIVTIEGMSTDFYNLHPDIKRIGLALNSGGLLWAMPCRVAERIFSLRKTFSQNSPDVILSFLTTINIMTVVACLFTGRSLILSERTNPRFQKINFLGRVMRRVLYPLCDGVVFVSKGVASQFPWLPEKKCLVIYNPIDVQPVTDAYDGPSFVPQQKYFLAMGRLEKVKGYDLLLNAYAKIAGMFPDWNLLILGEGRERSALMQQAEALGIAGRVLMPGCIKSTKAVVEKCDVFVLSSRYEGFPNALVEAMTEGVPVVSFDCQCGPSEIIDSMENGILVPALSVDDLADAMASLAGDEELRARIGREAKKRVQRLAIGSVAQEWESLIGRSLKVVR